MTRLKYKQKSSSPQNHSFNQSTNQPKCLVITACLFSFAFELLANK